MNQVGLLNNNNINNFKEANFENIISQNDPVVFNNEFMVNWNKKIEKNCREQNIQTKKKEGPNSSNEFLENEKISEKSLHYFTSNTTANTELQDSSNRNLNIETLSGLSGLLQTNKSGQLNNSIYEKTTHD